MFESVANVCLHVEKLITLRYKIIHIIKSALWEGKLYRWEYISYLGTVTYNVGSHYLSLTNIVTCTAGCSYGYGAPQVFFYFFFNFS